MSKNEEAFSTDFSEMTEKDDSLDVNEIFENQPALDEEGGTEKKASKESSKETSKEDDDKEGGDKDKAPNITEALSEAASEEEKETKEPDSKEGKEESEEEGEDTEAPVSKPKDISSSDAPFTIIFARDLDKQGLLSSFDEEKFAKEVEDNGEATALRNLIGQEINSNIDTAKEDLEAGYKEYLELIGKGVSPDTSASLMKLQDKYNSIDEDTLTEEDNLKQRREVITDYFRLTSRMPDEKIKKLVDQSFDMGNDVEDAQEYLTTLKTAIKDDIAGQKKDAEQRQTEMEQQKQQRLEELKDGINAINEIIPGQRINKQTKEKMYESLVKPTQDQNGNTTNALWAKRVEDPMFFDSRLAYLLDTGFFEKGKSWDKIKSVKTSKEASELEDYLSRKKNTDSVRGSHLNLEREKEDVSKIIEDTGSILK